MRRHAAPVQKLAVMSVALLMTGCGRLCVGGTPVEEIGCSQQGAATLSSATTSGAPTALILSGSGTSISGGPFEIVFVGGYLNLQVSSSFPDGATTYAFPSPVVTVAASITLPEAGYRNDVLHVVSGAITVAVANQNLLDASGSLTLADDSGQTFTVADITVHVACAYDETICR